MKQEKVIEIARGLNAIPIRGESREFAVVGNANITAFASEIERRALERAAVEAERMMMYPGGRQEAPAHDSVWHAARAIRALKDQS